MGWSDWFRKCPDGGSGGAEVGAAEIGVSHGLCPVRPAGAVLGPSVEDKLDSELFGLDLDRAEAVPRCD